MISDKNAVRFKGFAKIYDNARPTCPPYVVKTLSRYLGKKPKTLVDLGCGTGLSTLMWQNHAQNIIGIEPSDDMRIVAESNSKDFRNIKYIKAFSNDTGLPKETADLVTCSQSFHWMEPSATLKEVNRILELGGIFAVYDCDWPPVCSSDVEIAYENLMDKVKKLESENKRYAERFIRYSKDNHLHNIKSSGYFKYTREIVFANSEKCNAERFYNIAISQGGLQEIMKEDFLLVEKELYNLEKAVKLYFADRTILVDFCYRMRMGVK